MSELNVEIPGELESEFREIPNVELSILVSRLLRDELSKLVRFKRIVAKSKLTEEQAKELADEVSMSLAKRYNKLSAKFSKR